MVKCSLGLAYAVVAGMLVACGGGDGGGGGGGGGVGAGAGGAGGGAAVVAAAPPVTGTPTAVLSASQQTAASLAAAANSGATAANTVQGFNSLPLGIQLALPSGVTTTDTQPCAGGGTAAETDNVAKTNTTTVGDSAVISFSSCVESGLTFNGSVSLSITRFVNESNLTSSFSTSNLTVTQNGVARGPFSFNGQLDINAGQVSFSYDVSGTSVIGNATVTRSGNTSTIVSGVARVNLSSGGFVEIRYANWVFDVTTNRPTSGTATITGSGGTSGTISVQSDGYHCSITVNGVVSNFTVPF